MPTPFSSTATFEALRRRVSARNVALDGGEARAVLLGAVLLGCAAVLTGLVATGWAPLVRLDRTADADAHADVRATGWLLAAARGLTHLGDPVVVTVLAVAVAAVVFARGHRAAAVYLLVVRAAAVVVGETTKWAVARHRPVLPDPVAHATGYSYPSGHAIGAAACYLSLAVVAVAVPTAARVVLTLLAALVVATTRVLLGVHYPSDVLGGLLVGFGLALLAVPLASRPYPGATSGEGRMNGRA